MSFISRQWVSLGLGFALCLVACQSPPLLSMNDLENEYNAFQTQALRSAYLERKLAHWHATQQGDAMRREMEFARYKHPALLTAIMEDTERCQQYLDFSEISQYRIQSPAFATYIETFSCAKPPTGEFIVNDWPAGSQSLPKVAMHEDGRFVVVWTGAGAEDSAGIFARHYQANGEPSGPAFLVNTLTTGTQYTPDIDMNSNGDFIITWTDYNGAKRIYARRYDINGNALDAEAFPVSRETLAYGTLKLKPQVELFDDGRFVIAWLLDNSGSALYWQFFNANAQTEGSEQQPLGSTRVGYYDISSDAGKLLLAYYTSCSGCSSGSSHLKAYDIQGTALGDSTLIPGTTTGLGSNPRLAMQTGQNSLMVYQRPDNGISSGTAFQFTDGSTLLGTPQFANTYYINGQFNPDVAYHADQSFTVIWQGQGTEDSTGIYAQRFNALKAPQGNNFLVNTYTSGDQLYPAIAGDGQGNFIIVWQGGTGQTLPNGQSTGSEILAKRFDATGNVR